MKEKRMSERNMSAEDFLSSALMELASAAASGAAYKNWGDDFARKEIREVWENVGAPLRKKHSRKVTLSELQAANKLRLKDMGFLNWDNDLVVIPLWAFNYVADGERLVSIFGETKTKGQDEIDLDTRFGCIAYGFRPLAAGATP
jgi:hypothetical protein